MNAPQATEFVYTWYEDIDDDRVPGKWWAHRVLKRTKEFVFVQHKIGGYLSNHPWTRTRKLRRRELEENGRIFWHSGSRTYVEIYYSETGKNKRELEMTQSAYLPECLKVFGLTKGATADDVKRAYHELCMKEHPDAGGTHEGFLKLQENYQAALRLVK